MADMTSETKVPLLPLYYTPQYMLLRHIPTCMLHVCNAIDRISCFFYFFVETKCFLSQFERILYFWSVVCWTIANFVMYNRVISCLSGVSVHLDTVN